MQEIRGRGRECTNNKWPKHLITRYVSRYCPEEKTTKKTVRRLSAVIEEDRTYLLNPSLLFDRHIRRNGDSSGGPLFVLVKNGNLRIFVSRWQDQLAFYLQEIIVCLKYVFLRIASFRKELPNLFTLQILFTLWINCLIIW